MSQNLFTEADRTRIVWVKRALVATIESKLHELPKIMAHAIEFGAILSGGISASLFHDQEPNDLDIYFVNDECRAIFEKQLEIRLDVVTDVQNNYIENVVVPGKLITANAITLKNDIQIIDKRFARSDFDFIHCMPYYDIMLKKYYISPKQYHSIMDKKLIPNPHVKPKQKRIDKFIERGWTL
jgi:hypothetical protein